MRMNAGCCVLLAGLLPWLLAGCGPASLRQASASAPVPVAVATVEARRDRELLALPATLRPEARALVAAKVMGTISRADFGVGQRFNGGTVLVRIAAPEFEARRQQAESALEQARRDFEREGELAARGAATKELVRSFAQRLKGAQAALAEAEAATGHTAVATPFAGVVVRKDAREGDYVAAGSPLFILEGEDQLRAEVDVPESATELALGSRVGIMADGNERPAVTGELLEFSPTVDPISRTRFARIALPAAAGFRSGQFVRVLWPGVERNAVVVPVAALSAFGQLERVFVVAGNRAHLRLVRAAGTRDGRTEILAGVAVGERVVLNAPADLHDGQPVEARP